jgi:hypothetical protein
VLALMLMHAACVDETDDAWIDPEDYGGIWEHQGEPLTSISLRAVLRSIDADVPVEFEYFDGTGSRKLAAVHIDVRGSGSTPTALVFTIA